MNNLFDSKGNPIKSNDNEEKRFSNFYRNLKKFFSRLNSVHISLIFTLLTFLGVSTWTDLLDLNKTTKSYKFLNPDEFNVLLLPFEPVRKLYDSKHRN